MSTTTKKPKTPPAADGFDPAALALPTAGADPAPDPFDPAALRLSPDAAATFGVKKALITVPVRKPDKSWFVRVHPAPDYELVTMVIELKEDRGSETYLVAPHLRPGLAGEATFGTRMFVTAVNRQGVPFLWPLRMPDLDGRRDSWAESALDAARLAREGWVRVQANMHLGAYEVSRATGAIPDPVWPEQSLGELLKVAFRGRYIETADHPVLRQLRGEG